MPSGGESILMGGHEEIFDFLCSVCNRKNKITEAHKFCIDCQEYLCSTCVNLHNEFFINHEILDRAKFRPGSSASFPMVPTARCKVHGHKPVDMYCRQHGAVGCTTCMVLEHSACKDKVYVPDFIKNNTIDNSTTIGKQLRTVARSLDELKQMFLRDKTNIIGRKETSMQKIRKSRQEINQRLDELEKNSVMELEGVSQSLNDWIDASLAKLQTALTQVQSAQENIKSAGKNVAQMFVSIKMANAIASQAIEKVTAAKSQAPSMEISFVPNQQFQLLFSDIQALGSIHLEHKLECQPRSDGHFSPVATTQTNRTSLSSKKYNVKERSNEGIINIQSMCVLDNGTIILVECNNNLLKRLKPFSYQVRDSCNVTGARQVCAIGSRDVAVSCSSSQLIQIVAVSCSSSQLIQIVSIGYTMQKMRKINNGFDCYGLAYADGMLFISDEKTSVYVYTMMGDRLQQFSLPQSNFGILSRLLNNFDLCSVAVSDSRIYVAHKRKGLIILGRNGQLIGEITDPKLKGAHGVCLLKNNGVLVCGEDSNNVLQFTPDGKLIGEVLKRDKSCKSLFYSKKTSKLIVGGIGDEIEVYDISQ